MEAMLADSADLRRLVTSPVFSAEDQLRAITAIADKAGYEGLVANFLRVVARNRRPLCAAGHDRRLSSSGRRSARRSCRRRDQRPCADRRPAGGTQADAEGCGRQGCRAQPDGRSFPFSAVSSCASVRVRSTTSLKTKLNSLKLALKEVG